MRLVNIQNETTKVIRKIIFGRDKNVGKTHIRLMRLVKIQIPLTRNTMLIKLHIVFEKVYYVTQNESFFFDTDNDFTLDM